MLRPFSQSSNSLEGELIIEEVRPNCVEVFYVPPRDKLTKSALEPANDFRVKLLLFCGQDNYLKIYPTNTLSGHIKFLKPKYDQVESITLVGFNFPIPEDSNNVIDCLEELPSGFIKDLGYGLGLRKTYRFIIDAVEALSDCISIVICRNAATGIDKEDSTVFSISYKDFEEARKAVDRIDERSRAAARSENQTTIMNWLATRIGEAEIPIQIGRHPVMKLFARATQGDGYLGASDQDAVLNFMSKNMKTISKSKTEKLIKLQNDIELATLEHLIEHYGTMLGQKLNENRWQTFFNANPFVLNLAFGYPLIKVKDQASVGGRKLSGLGEKITDFLVKNSLTNNTALFEIKTPQTGLLNRSAYREGIFTPSRALSGSINQALDQKYQFQKQIADIKDTSRVHDIESYAVHSCLIIGTMPTEADRQKSFELFRRNSKDVEIVTFDELLEKLRQLRDFLVAGDEDDSHSTT